VLLGDLTGGRRGRADDGIDLLGERTVAGDEPLVASIMAAVAIIMPVTVVTASASPGLYALVSRSAH
jgi:hypothetical protein